MPIPNVSTLYQKINKGSEGGGEFARFMKLLLIAEYDSMGKTFISESDASGDYKKVDGYVPGDDDFPKLIQGFQFKFFPCNLSSNQKNEILHSIESALEENEFIQEFILVTPEDFQKEQQVWFDTLKERFKKSYWTESNGIYRQSSFKLIHWGHSKIIELALKHDHVGSRYFSELYPVGVGKFKLDSANIDCSISNWQPFEEDKFSYHQSDKFNGYLTPDPIFDFYFTNSSPEIFLLRKIEIHILEMTSQLKGPPAWVSDAHFLFSIGTIIHDIDFDKTINVIEFADPMIFYPSSPKRFKLQLRDFTINCPENSVKLKFWFHFSNYSIPTNSFYLSF